VNIGLDGEFGYTGSTSAEAIRTGVKIAIDEINRAGGVLHGRPLALVERANGSVPARSLLNLKELAAMPDLVAVFCGRFSPTVIEALPLIHQLKLPLLDPWAAADPIVDNHYPVNYVFRLSLRDSWAMPAMLRHAQAKGASRVGLLLLNTSWGRSSLLAAQDYVATHPELKISGVSWYNWADTSFVEKVSILRASGAQAVLMVANNDSQQIVIDMAGLPPEQRLPLISHWGITGGRFAELAGPALRGVDLSVVQTYTFIGATDPHAQRVVAAAQRLFHVKDARAIASPVGLAHAYDLTHILARAIELAGSTERSKVRDALEQVRHYDGLVKKFARPFAPGRHDALSASDVFMAEFAPDHAIVPLRGARKP
jgi:branched-chain amino acid transport system substrate-binding protein